jgi:signal transduction histidine kinase
VAELEATRNRALEAPGALDRAAADLRRELDDAARRLAAARSDASRARRKGERALSTSLTRLRVSSRELRPAPRSVRFWTRLRVLVQRARFTAGFLSGSVPAFSSP